MTRTTIAVVTTVLVVATVLTVYATGPSRKASNRLCLDGSPPQVVAVYCTVDPNKDRFVVAERTNAWERFKGAITGKP